jgi:hypothetical protein
MKVFIPYRPAHIVLFLLLAVLCYQAHQWVRHFAGAAFCGGFGSMTFTVATVRAPCFPDVLVTLSGPILTYGLAYLGMFLLRSKKLALFAYALIFASFSHLRFIQTLTGRGDELILAQPWSAVLSRPVVAFLVFLIGLPPVLAVYRVIANCRRLSIFVGSWLLPLPLLFVMLFSDRLLFGESHTVPAGASFLGISLIVLITDLAGLALLAIFGPRYIPPTEQAHAG